MKTNKAQLSSMKTGLLIIILAIGIVALGLLTEEKPKPELVPEEGEMFSPLLAGGSTNPDIIYVDPATNERYRYHSSSRLHLNILNEEGTNEAGTSAMDIDTGTIYLRPPDNSYIYIREDGSSLLEPGTGYRYNQIPGERYRYISENDDVSTIDTYTGNRGSYEGSPLPPRTPPSTKPDIIYISPVTNEEYIWDSSARLHFNSDQSSAMDINTGNIYDYNRNIGGLFISRDGGSSALERGTGNRYNLVPGQNLEDPPIYLKEDRTMARNAWNGDMVDYDIFLPPPPPPTSTPIPPGYTYNPNSGTYTQISTGTTYTYDFSSRLFLNADESSAIDSTGNVYTRPSDTSQLYITADSGSVLLRGTGYQYNPIPGHTDENMYISETGLTTITITDGGQSYSLESTSIPPITYSGGENNVVWETTGGVSRFTGWIQVENQDGYSSYIPLNGDFYIDYEGDIWARDGDGNSYYMVNDMFDRYGERTLDTDLDFSIDQTDTEAMGDFGLNRATLASGSRLGEDTAADRIRDGTPPGTSDDGSPGATVGTDGEAPPQPTIPTYIVTVRTIGGGTRTEEIPYSSEQDLRKFLNNNGYPDSSIVSINLKPGGSTSGQTTWIFETTDGQRHTINADTEDIARQRAGNIANLMGWGGVRSVKAAPLQGAPLQITYQGRDITLRWNNELGVYQGIGADSIYTATDESGRFNKAMNLGNTGSTTSISATEHYDSSGDLIDATIEGNTMDLETYTQMRGASSGNDITMSNNQIIIRPKGGGNPIMRVSGLTGTTATPTTPGTITVESGFVSFGDNTVRPTNTVTRTTDDNNNLLADTAVQINPDTNGDGQVNSDDHRDGIHTLDVENHYAFRDGVRNPSQDTVTYTDYDQSDVTSTNPETRTESTTYNKNTLEPNRVTVYDKDGNELTASIERRVTVGEDGQVVVELTLVGDKQAQERLTTLQSQYNSRRAFAEHEYAFTAFSGLRGFSRLIWDDEDLADWRQAVDNAFCNTILLGGEDCWVSQLCQAKIEQIPDNVMLIETPSGLMVTAAHIEAERSQPLEYIDETTGETIIEYLYKITFVIHYPETDIPEGYPDLNADLVLYGDITFDGFPTVTVEEGDILRYVGDQAIVDYSSTIYNKACLHFDRNLESIDHTLINEICVTITESTAEPSTILPEGEGDDDSELNEVDF